MRPPRTPKLDQVAAYKRAAENVHREREVLAVDSAMQNVQRSLAAYAMCKAIRALERLPAADARDALHALREALPAFEHRHGAGRPACLACLVEEHRGRVLPLRRSKP